METTTSFAPLAGRLAAHAAELRPMAGSRDTMAKLAALVMCLLLDMLICVCEMLDARAALDARSMQTLIAPRGDKSASVLAARVERQAPSSERCARSPDCELQAGVAAPRPADAPSETAAAPLCGPWLMWSRDAGLFRAVLAPSGRPRRETRFFDLIPRTSILLRYRNELPGWGEAGPWRRSTLVPSSV